MSNHVMFGPRIWVEGVGAHTCSSKLLINQQILMLKWLVYCLVSRLSD